MLLFWMRGRTRSALAIMMMMMMMMGMGRRRRKGRGWGICAVLGLAPRLAPGICHLHIPRTFTPLFQIYLYCEFFSPVCASPMNHASAFPLILLNPMQINNTILLPSQDLIKKMNTPQISRVYEITYIKYMCLF